MIIFLVHSAPESTAIQGRGNWESGSGPYLLSTSPQPRPVLASTSRPTERQSGAALRQATRKQYFKK